MNGLSSRSSRAERRRVRHSSGSDLEGSEGQENMKNADDSDHSRQPRKTAMAAVNKMKLIDASEEEDTSEHKSRSRTGKRAAVIQSSSESEEHDQQGRSNLFNFLIYSVMTCLRYEIEWSMATISFTEVIRKIDP